MRQTSFKVAVSEDVIVTAIRMEPDGESSRWCVAYAPGAGSNVHDPFGICLSERLAEAGHASVRIQYPYMEARKRRPDRVKMLEATWRAVIAQRGGSDLRLCVGGRSMGGRIASQVVAGGVEVDALALYAYPLHPPGNPNRRRDEHLSAIQVQTLFCSGARDSFASPDELQDAARLVRRSTVHTLDAADHGFSALKSSGRVREDIWTEAVEVLLDWLPR